MIKRRYLFIFISGIFFSVPFIFPWLHMLSFFSAVPYFIIIFDAVKNNKNNKIIRYTFVFGMSFYLPVYIWFLWMYPMEQTGVTPLQSAFIVIAAWLGFPLLQTFVMLILPIGLKLILRPVTLNGVKGLSKDSSQAQNDNRGEVNKNDNRGEVNKNNNWGRVNKLDINIFFLPVLTACLYVILEWVQSWFMSGLTWAKLSISQYKDLFFIQSVSLFGTYFTSFLIIFINSAIALYILNKSSGIVIPDLIRDLPLYGGGLRVKPAMMQRVAGCCDNYNLLILAVILLYFANSYFGCFRVMYYDYIEKIEKIDKIEINGERRKITAQVMQGNISSYEKWEVAGFENSFKVYESLLKENVGESIDICVFPETAIPVRISRESRLYGRLSDLAGEYNITLFTGVIYSDKGDTDDEYKEYNAIMAFDKNYEFIKPYGKRHLVPFGEYLPAENILKSVFPFVAKMTLFDSVLTPGERSDIITANGVNYGGLVCFDSIFPELARKSTKDGADILIIVTNDSWFRDSPAIYQHNAQAVLRAVENNRYVIRSANTGVSSFITNTGKILQQSDVLRREVLTEDIAVIKNKTLYTVIGDVILYLSWGYVAFCVIWRIKYIKKY